MGTRWNCLAEAVLTSTHNLCFEQKYENCQNFSSESFHFWVVKFSIYLYRRVFVMPSTHGINRRFVNIHAPKFSADGFFKECVCVCVCVCVCMCMCVC